jgi:hypothetical protein
MKASGRRGPGRSRSVPEAFFGTVFQWYSLGWGYRRIANELTALGALTSKSSIERVVKGLPPYQGRRVRPA